MLMVNIDLHRITVLDFNGIFNKYIEPDLIADLDRFGLVHDGRFNIKDKNVKRFFYHHLIDGISKFFLENKIKNRSIILYTKLAPAGHQIHQMCDVPMLQMFLDRTIAKISKILPLKWYVADTTFGQLTHCIKGDGGDSSDLINRLRFTMDKYDTSKFTYTKARSFAKRHGLDFLTSNFFKKIYSKQLILS